MTGRKYLISEQPKDIQFTVIYDKEKPCMFKSQKLELQKAYGSAFKKKLLFCWWTNQLIPLL